MSIASDGNSLQHYGILRKSGRYPWGSGDSPEQRARTFIDMVADLRRKGFSDKEIAESFEMKTSDLRNTTTLARNAKKQADISMVAKLKYERQMSNVAISKKLGIPEPTVRSLLKPGAKDRADILEATSNKLKDEVAKKKYLDVGAGTELQLGISNTKLKAAVARLRNEEGYKLYYVKVPQLGTSHETTMRVLVKPDTEYNELLANRDQIRTPEGYSEDGGKTFLAIKPPLSISSKRVAIKYGPDGGAEADGVIYVRPGVDDIHMGKSRYGQVRIAVDGTHYLKGMAMYKDDLPSGVDLMFNTNKTDTGNKHDAMKKMQRKFVEGKDNPKDKPDKWSGPVDMENPFGAIIRRQILTPDGTKPTSVMNMLTEEGGWEEWSRTLSSQMLSKQSPNLAKTQLALTRERKRREFQEIMELNNPAVKKRLLEGFADSVDSAAVHLKAANMPRQANKVILPLNKMKDTEVYAPTFKDGETVVLIRFPHGGTFEIPQLKVNNRHPQGRKLLGDVPDAIGIHPKVAEKLSGADFDGDTVLVIPNNQGLIKTKSPLKGLENFDPKLEYKAYEGMPQMSSRTKGMQMGLVSNLITDMTIRGASDDELARAVRHSMVVIDAEKHHLDYKRSAINNGIPALMEKYQNKKTGGASTLLSRKKQEIDVPERKQGYKIDPQTGRKIYTPTGANFPDKKTGETVWKTQKVKRLAEIDDAHKMSSGRIVEKHYADHSNALKELANEARKAMLAVKTIPYNPSARTAYSAEVASLNVKLTQALRNAPRERQAQVLANAMFNAQKASHPDLEKSEIKKLKFIALRTARARVGAKKHPIELTDSEWDAIQAGAITQHKLNQILTHADLDQIKKLATPKSALALSPNMLARARSMAKQGESIGDIADALGISTSTLQKNMGGE